MDKEGRPEGERQQERTETWRKERNEESYTVPTVVTFPQPSSRTVGQAPELPSQEQSRLEGSKCVMFVRFQ